MSPENRSAFNPEDFLQRLEASARARRKIEAHRPSPSDAGQALVIATRLARNVIDASRDEVRRAYEADSNGNHWLAVPESQAAHDRAWTEAHLDLVVLTDEDGEPLNHLNHPLIDPIQCGIDLVHRLTRSAVDHLEGLGLLMAHNAGLRAPMTLSRSVLEATASALYLMDNEANTRERLRRVWNQQLKDLRELLLAAPEPNEEKTALNEQEMIIGAAENLGFATTPIKSRKTQVAVLADNGTPGASSQQVIEHALDSEVGSTTWRALSRVAHSGESLFLVLDHIDYDAQIPAMRAESVAAGSMASLLVFAQLGDEIERYLGWHQSSWSKDFDTVLQLWGAVAGWSDDTIRLKLGLPPV